MITKAELIIHPVRLRIAGALSAGPMSTKELAGVLPDVPQATLYRHVHVLAEHGIVRVVAERNVNGIVESTYALHRGAARFDRDEFAAIPASDQIRYFGIFLGAQMIDAEAYFRQARGDTSRDGVTYFRAGLRLTDGEARRLRTDLHALMKRYKLPPREGRRLRYVGVSSFPRPRVED